MDQKGQRGVEEPSSRSKRHSIATPTSKLNFATASSSAKSKNQNEKGVGLGFKLQGARPGSSTVGFGPVLAQKTFDGSQSTKAKPKNHMTSNLSILNAKSTKDFDGLFEDDDTLNQINSLEQLVSICHPTIQFDNKSAQRILRIKGKRYLFNIASKRPQSVVRIEVPAKTPPPAPEPQKVEATNEMRRTSLMARTSVSFKRQSTLASPAPKQPSGPCTDRDCHCHVTKDKLQAIINQKDEEINSLINKLKGLKDSQDKLKEFLSKDDLVSMEKEVIRDEFIKLLSATEIQDDRQHIAVLHASPLGFKTTDKKGGKIFKVSAPLDFIQDINGIQEALKVTERQINFKVKLGTPMNLVNTLNRDPMVLHIISHGIPVDKNKTALLLENEDGTGTLIPPTKLRMLIEVSAAHLDIVFLSSCHSEALSEVIIELGAKHVICIDKDKTVKDDACIVFSRAYYQNLFTRQMTPCKAFELAKGALIAEPALESQAKLFKLKVSKNHYCNPYSLLRGHPKNLDLMNPDLRLKPNSMPSKVDNFIGRQEEMKDILNLLLTNRIITITGVQGIGKSAIAKMIANYLYDRQHQYAKQGHSPGILFISLSNVSTIHQILFKFIKKFLESMQKQIPKFDKKDSHVLFNQILELIGQKKFLFILDDCEDCLKNDKQLFKELIEEILSRCNNTRILFTSKIEVGTYLGGFKGFGEQVFKIKSLSTKESEDLLQAKSGKRIPMEDKANMSNMKPEKGLRTQLRNAYTHLFEELLSGHPHAVNLAAATYKECSLIELYQKLNSEDQHEGLQYKEAHREMQASLRLSLKLIQDFRAKIMFGFIAYFSGGVRPKDVCRITQNILQNGMTQEVMKFENKEIYQFLQLTEQQQLVTIESLMKASLVQKNKFTFQKKSVEVYKLLRLMKKFAIHSSLNVNQRQYFNQYILDFYVKKLEGLYKKNNRAENESNDKVMNKIFFYEANIWDCIYRGLKDIGINKNQLTLEQEEENSLKQRERSAPELKLEEVKEQELPSQPQMQPIPSESDFFDTELDRNGPSRGGETSKPSSNQGFLFGLKDALVAKVQRVKTIPSPSKQNMMENKNEVPVNIIQSQIHQEMVNQPTAQGKNACVKLAHELQKMMKKDMKIDLEDANLVDYLVQTKALQSFQSELSRNDDLKRSKSPDVLKRDHEDRVKNIKDSIAEEVKEKFNLNKTLEQERPKSAFPRDSSQRSLEDGDQVEDKIIDKMNQNKYKLKEDIHRFKNHIENPPLYVQLMKTKKFKDLKPLEHLLVLFVTNLLLMKKKLYPIKIIDQYGKRFFDKDLCEANLRKLKGIALINKKNDDKWENCIVATKEFIKASVIFGQLECSLGLAQCNAAIGYVLSVTLMQYMSPDDERPTLYKARKKYQEALKHYEKINHLKGQSYCLLRLHEINKTLVLKSRHEYDHHVRLENLYHERVLQGDRSFIERKQGIEISLFTEPVISCLDIIKTNKADQGNILNQIINGILLKNNYVKEFKEKKQHEYDKFLDQISDAVQQNQRAIGEGSESCFSTESRNDAFKGVQQQLHHPTISKFKKVADQSPQGTPLKQRVSHIRGSHGGSQNSTKSGGGVPKGTIYRNIPQKAQIEMMSNNGGGDIVTTPSTTTLSKLAGGISSPDYRSFERNKKSPASGRPPPTTSSPYTPILKKNNFLSSNRDYGEKTQTPLKKRATGQSSGQPLSSYTRSSSKSTTHSRPASALKK